MLRSHKYHKTFCACSTLGDWSLEFKTFSSLKGIKELMKCICPCKTIDLSLL